MLRRRLSPLTRLALGAAHACARELADFRIVFASRHGELARTTAMLECLADGEAVSPASFSMSVLNAGAGLFSMLRGNTAPVTAISAGRASFGYGVLEACLQLAGDPGRPVLYVYADEPAPPVYGEAEPPGSEAHALGMLLASAAERRVACSVAADAAGPAREAQSRAFLGCLAAGAAAWSDAGRRWLWSRAA
jgi:hypothetical protein